MMSLDELQVISAFVISRQLILYPSTLPKKHQYSQIGDRFKTARVIAQNVRSLSAIAIAATTMNASHTVPM